MLAPILLTPRENGVSIQSWLRQAVISAIGDGRLATGQKLPPSRALARQASISRNTVTAVYEDLVAKGYLVSRERQGYFVAEHNNITSFPLGGAGTQIAWDQKFTKAPSDLRRIIKPTNWQSFRYPFIYGQVDRDIFPIDTWRACSRDALGRSAIDYWAADRAVEDDPLLIEQLCRHVLPTRGIFARPDEVMITLGSQQALYLLNELFTEPGDKVAIECPAYPDARNMFLTAGNQLVELPVDDEGVILDRPLNDVRLMLVTPTNHCPTMVPLSLPRRHALLEQARREDFLLIEDDYEGEIGPEDTMPALKSLDSEGRVLYVGTLSKVLAPGVRIGYLVAPAPVIAEARGLRQLMHRSAPLNNQRTAAIFLSEGYYLGLLRTLKAKLAERHQLICEAIDKHLPDFHRNRFGGGSAVWLGCPEDIKASELIASAAEQGVLIEDGDPFVPANQKGCFVRLGVSSIDKDLIEPGIRLIADTVSRMREQKAKRAAGSF